MSEDALPSNLQDFITQNVRSLEQLEILLLVSRDRKTVWTVTMVYDVIMSTMPSVERWLIEFTRLGFLRQEPGEVPGYQFIATDETAALVRELGQLYKTRSVRVIESIFNSDRNASPKLKRSH